MAGSKGSKYYNIFLDYNIWLKRKDDESKVLTEEHLSLLNGIDKSGSLAAAATNLKISYRKAWGIIRDAESILGFHLIDKHRGGKSGGHSDLTEEGKSLLIAYREMREDFDASVKRIVKDFFQKINS